MLKTTVSSDLSPLNVAVVDYEELERWSEYCVHVPR